MAESKTEIEKSIDRMFWRIKEAAKTKKFIPNQSDIDAMTFIANWVNSRNEETLREQQLLAKLYSYVFTDKLSKNLNLAQSIGEMNTLCETPLEYYFKEFHFRFNALKYWSYLEQNKIDFIQEKYQTKEEKELIMWHIQHDENFMKHALGYWSPEKTEISLTNQITDTLYKYKNLP